MKEYSLITTYKCNWDCPYCIQSDLGKNRTTESVIDAVRKVDPRSWVSLSGGEPGMLTEDVLFEIVSILKEKDCITSICSNGQIFRYPKIVEMSDHILYHCSMNMELGDVVIKNVTDTPVEYVVIVTDNNFNNLDPFLEKHSDINIGLVPGSARSESARLNGDSLGNKNRIKMIQKYRDYISDENFELLLSFEDRGCDDIYI